MFLVYNCGYHSTINLEGPATKRKYSFKRRFVTRVDNKDAEAFLEMTSNSIPWCPTNSKLLPPFMKLEDWCRGEVGRFDFKPFKIYDPQDYKEKFLL